MTDNAPYLERAFNLTFSERSYRIDKIEGKVPDFVRGTYYNNGPSRFGVAEMRYRHWLDGDGMICSLRFEDDGVCFTNRFVRSTKFVDETEAGRPLYRTFGTAFDGDRLARYGTGIESPVNVSVWMFAGRLLAFGEQGLPWELDPITLETRGLHDFGRSLNAVSPFSAHPSIDYDTGEMFNFGISFSQSRPTLNLYRFGADGQMVYRRRLPIPDPCTVHDFSLSPSYVVVYLNSYLLDMEALLRRGGSVMDALEWRPERSSSLLVAARESGEEVARIPIDPGYCLHIVNSFEEDGRLILDIEELEEPVYDQYQVIPDLFADVGPARPTRFVIDTASWQVMEKRVIESKLASDFPSIDPRRTLRSNDHFWLLSISKTGQPDRKFFDQLTHVDFSRERITDTYRVPPGCYLGNEPIFIGAPGEESQGVVICKRFDAENREDSFLLFDAYDVAAGPIATLHLEEPTPPGFHASFHPPFRDA